jgi:hypothetical protein
MTTRRWTLHRSPRARSSPPFPADDRDALVSRREAIARGAKSSALMHMALAAGSVPVALAALSSEVYGQAPARR